MFRLSLCAPILCLTLAASGNAAEPAVDDAQSPAKLAVQVNVELDYLIYLPPDYEKKESWPLLLFLHGAGERGKNLDLVKIHGPPMLIAQGKHFPFIVVSPQAPKDGWWHAIELVALLDEVSRNHKVDEDRVVVTGLSMGGFGTWSLAAYAPHRLAAIAPICGGGEPYRAKRFPHLPTWVFHGAKDTGVPIRRSQEMVDALKKAKGNVQFTIYPEAGHNSWTETYNNPKLYEWLLAQKRTRE